jgi:putative ubiquitin-RnfH superfamily antitoxin RatB of RatAB toxin-antitoxin module
MRIELVYSPSPRCVHRVTVELPPGATVVQALQASGWLGRVLPADPGGLRVGVWGRAAQAHSPLRDDDRVEVYRDLRVDPKEARRQRYRGHLDRYGKKR